jgi:hypothetical protein
MKYESPEFLWIMSDVKLEKNSRRMYRSLDPPSTSESKLFYVLQELIKIPRKYDDFYVCNPKGPSPNRPDHEREFNFRLYIPQKLTRKSFCTS